MKCTAVFLTLLGMLNASPAFSQTVNPSESQPVAPLAGPNYTPAFGQWSIGFYGTDLGITMKHQGQLRIVFGDTWASALITTIGATADDTQGIICLRSFGCPSGGVALESGSDVEEFTGFDDGNFFDRVAPPVVFEETWGSIDGIEVFDGDDGFFDSPLDMGPLRTPVTAFSNGLSGSASGAFALFSRAEPVTCSSSCSSGFTCDGSLGLDLFGAVCEAGAAGCIGGGVCVNPASPRYDSSSWDGRARAAAYRLRVGNAHPLIRHRYFTQPWDTHLFLNPSAVTVDSYDLNRANLRGAGSVAIPQPAQGPRSGQERVFIWGRPSFAATDSHPSDLYFAVSDLPGYDADGEFVWNPLYYAGPDGAGGVLFTADESQAAPIIEDEPLNIINQMSVRYLPELQKWVMLYGGDVIGDALLNAFSSGQGPLLKPNPQRAIHIRFADDPWGPWTTEQVLLSGDAQYAPGGVLHSASCAPPLDCVQGELFWDLFLLPPSQPGFLYGANLIPEWSVEVDANTLDIYYNVSTFAPYQVVLMKSRIHH